MTPRWHRSRLFWSGLAGLVLLLVLWLGCVRWAGGGGYVGRGVGLAYGKYPGSLYFHYADWKHLHPPPPDGSSFTMHRIPSDIPAPLLAPAFSRSSNDAGVRSFYVAHWLIVAAYTVLWICGMIWWQRRKHRLTLPATPSPAARSSTKAHASRP